MGIYTYFGFRMWDFGCGMSDVGFRMWDVGCGMSDVGCRMWDVGCGMSDVGFRMWDFGFALSSELLFTFLEALLILLDSLEAHTHI
jgi:hypothetical protein